MLFRSHVAAGWFEQSDVAPGQVLQVVEEGLERLTHLRRVMQVPELEECRAEPETGTDPAEGPDLEELVREAVHGRARDAGPSSELAHAQYRLRTKSAEEDEGAGDERSGVSIRLGGHDGLLGNDHHRVWAVADDPRSKVTGSTPRNRNPLAPFMSFACAASHQP